MQYVKQDKRYNLLCFHGYNLSGFSNQSDYKGEGIKKTSADAIAGIRPVAAGVLWGKRRQGVPSGLALRIKSKDIARARVSYGCWRIHIMLLREGWKVNHKQVYQLYKLEYF